MSEPQQVGEPVVNVEKVVTVLPDGRKVTKTIKKITHSYQVQVPAGGPVPEGATLVSTSTAEAPIVNHNTVSYQQSSGSESNSLKPEGYETFNTVNNAINYDGVVKTEPTVVVSTTVDENGRKVTKTKTTTSSSSGSSPFSKLFKRFSSKPSSSDAKPLPAVPASQVQPQEKKPQVVQSVSVPVPVLTSNKAPEAEMAPRTKVLEAKKPDGTKVPLSNCTGHRRALLIGINYTGHPNPLQGCINDTAVMKTFLLNYGFEEKHIRVMTDDQHGTKWMPTRENILEQLRWLIHDAEKNDSYFLHYSGHGGQVVDLDGDETEGMDNCIFPLDHLENGVIVDDELHTVLVKALPPGVRLTVVFDCCHSGSALDLPYIYASTGYVRGSSALANLGHEMVLANFDEKILKELHQKWEALQLEEKEFARQVSLKAADADVIMFSGCKDDQTSADVSVTRGGKSSSNGAMTYAFTKCINENPEQSYQEMLNNIRELLKDKYKQKPQLSSSRAMKMEELFHM
ncbi:Ca(2+)-dependent cysteine protease [Dissophora globulifera]|uniref:Ca(2+)-dependent cysteine protease n=1 Tax=Dissophora globulifera TaxID=979702 RepID=A0A9P6UQS7_9FUNG|nr:Ca(2+)-dependent cysteine protease [Dissophora globulifera]